MVIVLATALLLAVGIAVVTWRRAAASADVDPHRCHPKVGCPTPAG
jgi:hypothetical protein